LLQTPRPRDSGRPGASAALIKIRSTQFRQGATGLAAEVKADLSTESVHKPTGHAEAAPRESMAYRRALAPAELPR
jgi:hypothetical protein